MSSGRERTVTRLHDELPAIVTRSVEAIRAAVPAYRDLRGPQLDEVEHIAARSLRRLLDLWIDDSDIERDRLAFRAIGTARAADGRPLTDILRAYRVASDVFVRHVVDHHLDDLEPADVADLSLMVLRTLDAVSEAIIDAYTAYRDRLTSDRGQAQAAFLDDLVAGRQNSSGAIADRSRQLELALAGRPRLLIVDPTDPTRPVSEHDLDTILRALGATPHTDRSDRTPRTHLRTRRGTRGIVLLPTTVDRVALDTVCAALDLHGCLMSGRPIADVAAAYRLACDGLDTAPGHAFADRTLLDDGDCQLLVLLTARATADTDAVVSSVLGPLRDPSNTHLLDGLRAFISTGTATAAAAELHVHPQTLRYRLRRAQELTGRDPRHAWHRLALDTAIQLQQLAGPIRTR
ncbi:PucR family transcriptional regulator [Williamsia maris]|uniref:DNA-binding transcriptional regulator, PucR family n=1 Tax=Williamsia maris TaxID=72806 RepID=A0ABT1HJ66_9NOCA|nr:helix-turn-helix domain-containing protein [Williamsia maris]MCP2177972.1 DNA-binding transcriptional regulator, PucR family [Williamsia maris]